MSGCTWICSQSGGRSVSGLAFDGKKVKREIKIDEYMKKNYKDKIRT